MSNYLLRRVAQLVLVFFGVTFFIFAAVYALPGDPIRALAGDRPVSASVIAHLHELHHLDDPLLMQYGLYLRDLVSGNLGTTFTGRSVGDLLGERWPVTIRLALMAWLIEVVVGISLGVLAALRRGRWFDNTVLFFTIAVISVPVFVVAYTAQYLLGVKAGILPVSGADDGWLSYLMPATILAAFGLASVARLTRTSMLENLRADYVRTATAKGLGRRRIVISHVLRNSLIPAVTYLGIDLGYLLSGTVIIEGIFNLPGVGDLLFTSISNQDGPVVVGVATMLVLIFLTANLIVDLLYGALDPRIRHD
ncbi:ABC transporter permease [Rhodococcus sp. SC4]|nr:ABC transporter permease [Rhodococcus sp. SC4]